MTSVLFVIVFAFTANAQASRTWVSGVGDDVNPCSRTAPCKTFAGAITKTAAGGEIDALDPGGFGTLTITKSITIDGAGTLASVLASGGINGFNINAGANDVVVIRNISIQGLGNATNPANNGIQINSAKTVIIENCEIQGFKGGSLASQGNGINDERTNVGAQSLMITNTNILDSRSWGIRINPNGASILAVIEKTRLEISGSAGGGLSVNAAANVTIRDSILSAGTGTGVFAEQLNGAVEVDLENCIVTNNNTGISTSGPNVRLSNTLVTRNGTGLSGTNIFSFGNNNIAGNINGNGPIPAANKIPQQ